MNEVFLFLLQGLGLGSLQDLLVYFASMESAPTSLRFSEEEYLFLRDYDMRAGLEPLAIEGYTAFPPTRLIAITHYLMMALLLPNLSEAARIAFKSICHLGWLFQTVVRTSNANYGSHRLPFSHGFALQSAAHPSTRSETLDDTEC